MHEYPITKKIIETAARHAAAHGSEKVTKICLAVGDDSGCLADSVELYFGIIAEGTVCEGARLEIERVRPMLRCNVCGQLFVRRPFMFSCTYDGCPGEGEPTEIGREFLIKTIEISPGGDKDA